MSLTTRTFFHINNHNTKITLGNLTWLQKYYLGLPWAKSCYLFTRELWIRLPVQGTSVQFLAGKIPHAAGQLSLCMPQLLKPQCPWTCSLQWEKPRQWETRAQQLESSLLTATRGTQAQWHRPGAAENK